jgi:tetratricopeptide (TPR) repeat protein
VHYGVYLRKYPNTSDAWFGLGYSYMRLDLPEKAIDAFNRSLEIFKDKEANTYINIATCYNMMQEYQLSIDHYSIAFEVNPNLITVPNLNHEFGFTYVQLGEFEKAMEIFKKMEVGQDERRARSYRSQALLLFYNGRLSEGIEQLHKSVLIYKTPGNELSRLRDILFMASAFKTKGMMKEYYMQLNRADEILNNDENVFGPWWLFVLGKYYIRGEDFEKAEELLQLLSTRINEGNREDEAALSLLRGEIEMVKGNLPKAIEMFESAINQRNDCYTVESIANYYNYIGNLDLAISKYKEIIDLKDALGWEAQEYWVRAHYNLGKLYEEKGDILQAADFYERFLNIWQDADDDIPILLDCQNRLERLKAM